MDEKIKKILEAAIQAPSGENCQPWLVKIDANKMELYNDPGKDMSLYNHDQKGSMVSLGAFIENLSIAAKTEGLDVQMSLFPDNSNRDFVATINFLPISPIPDSLFAAIFKRTSNRKAYKKISISEELKSAITDSATEIGFGRVILIEDPAQIEKLSKSISLNERLIFENQSLHNFFYNHVRWTKDEDEKFKNGFFIETLELKPPQKFMMKILKSWPWAVRAKFIGITKQIAKDNAKNYSTASILGVVTIPTNSRKDYLLGGRVMERVWLKITAAGLSLQPMTGVLFFAQRILAGETKEFSSEEIDLIKKAHTEIVEGFGTGKETIAMLFRVGDGGEPSARSPRFDLSQIMKS